MRQKLYSFALLALLALAIPSCATSVRYDPPAAMGATPQAIMTAKPCTEMPQNHQESVNAPGWERLTAFQVTCGGKYASGAYRCKDPSKCQPLVYQASPTDPTDRGKVWHFMTDGQNGKFSVCAEATMRFGVGNLDCKPVEYSGTVRAISEVKVPAGAAGSTQTSTTIEVVIVALAPDTVIGQIGTAESPSPVVPPTIPTTPGPN